MKSSADTFDGIFLHRARFWERTFVSVERHAAGMVEAWPALAPVLVQHEAMANDGGALGGGNQVKSVYCPSKHHRVPVSSSGSCVPADD